MKKMIALLSFLASSLVCLIILVTVKANNYRYESAFKANSSFFFMNRASKELKDTSYRIKQYQNSQSLTFEFITDSHYSNNLYGKKALKHFDEVKNLSQMVGSDFIVHGGDIIDGNYKKEKSLKKLKKGVNELLKDTDCPLYLVRGNHDDNYCYNEHHSPNTWKNIIAPEIMYKCLIKPNEDKIVRGNSNNSLYYYRDIPYKKLRVVVLDTNDYIGRFNDKQGYKYQYELSAEQLKWAAEKAFNLTTYKNSQEWGVLIFSHIAFNRKINDNQEVINGEYLLKLIKGLRNGQRVDIKIQENGKVIDISGSFNLQKPVDFTCIISGDCHEDHILVEDKIIQVVTLNSIPLKFKSQITPVRVLNSSSENAFDTFIINRKKREINIIRHGAGQDRRLNY